MAQLNVGFILARRFTLCALRRTSSTCCGSPPTRATGRGRSSAPGGCCRRRWSRSPRAAASWSSPRSGSAIPARFDYLVVVGGLVDEIENLHPDTVRFLERAAAAGVPLVGVCTGTFALHRAGLMRGYRACVSWFHHEDFLERFDGLEPVSDQIFVVDRDRLTCSGGVSSAHLAAFIVERHLGAGAGGEEPAHHDHRRGDGGGGAAAGHAAGARHRRRAGAEGAPRHAAVDRRAALDRPGGGAARGRAGASSSGTSARRWAMTPLEADRLIRVEQAKHLLGDEPAVGDADRDRHRLLRPAAPDPGVPGRRGDDAGGLSARAGAGLTGPRRGSGRAPVGPRPPPLPPSRPARKTPPTFTSGTPRACSEASARVAPTS